jgi:colicin import membrane protein
MKKLFLCYLLLAFSFQFYAQQSATKSPVKTQNKKSIIKKNDPPKETKETAAVVREKKSQIASSTKIPAKNTVKNHPKTTVVVSKQTGEKGQKVSATSLSKTKTVKKTTTVKQLRLTDKVSGTYNGKKVYTGPKGGKYYINKNGNKTYIK